MAWARQAQDRHPCEDSRDSRAKPRIKILVAGIIWVVFVDAAPERLQGQQLRESCCTMGLQPAVGCVNRQAPRCSPLRSAPPPPPPRPSFTRKNKPKKTKGPQAPRRKPYHHPFFRSQQPPTSLPLTAARPSIVPLVTLQDLASRILRSSGVKWACLKHPKDSTNKTVLFSASSRAVKGSEP